MNATDEQQPQQTEMSAPPPLSKVRRGISSLHSTSSRTESAGANPDLRPAWKHAASRKSRLTPATNGYVSRWLVDIGAKIEA
jgi:hypothetical protein